MKNRAPGICRRLSEVRIMHYGPRGKARFARDLDLGPSTYNHYEVDRTPSAELLVQVARLTGTNIEWLLTGEGVMEVAEVDDSESRFDDLLTRCRRLLTSRPELARCIDGFLDLLEEVEESFPEQHVRKRVGQVSTSDLIPVVGSTSAGRAHFWEEIEQTVGGPEADSRLEGLLRKHSQRAVRSAELTASESEANKESDLVSLIQFSQPDELGFIEFLSCPNTKEKYPQAVAWRIDGDSMSPRYRDGDFVITSEDYPAVQGQPCVARQKGQIGVNCKIYSQQGDTISLIPINEVFSVQGVPAKELLWAYRTLCSVRLSGH